MSRSVPVITIDGPSGSGKGTVSQRLARDLGWHYLDSGALYRLVGLAAERHRVALDDEAALAALAEALDVEFDLHADDLKVVLEGEDVTLAIRSETAGNRASKVAALPAVRTALVARQHAFRRLPGLVTDGRDMGTVIFPDAPLKLFLTASAEERANRRYKQLKEKGIDANISNLVAEIAERDARDSQRSTAPLRPAEDAIEVETSSIGIEEVMQQVARLCRQRFGDQVL